MIDACEKTITQKTYLGLEKKKKKKKKKKSITANEWKLKGKGRNGCKRRRSGWMGGRFSIWEVARTAVLQARRRKREEEGTGLEEESRSDVGILRCEQNACARRKPSLDKLLCKIGLLCKILCHVHVPGGICVWHI